MHGKKIIFFELNEVPYRVLDEYCRKRPGSKLARILPRCRQFQTRADDEVLDPWVTWPTVYRGVDDRKHTIHWFGQHLESIDAKYPPIWKILAEHGLKTGVFSSLHTYPLPKNIENYAFYLPDNFATGSETFPESLRSFQDFNLSMARRSGRNVSTAIPLKSASRFLAQAPFLGLKSRTLIETAEQVIAERFNPWRRVRRRTYQVVLGFDLFMKQLRRTQPDFATFHTNHVASAMHRYWAALFPGDYEKLDYDAEWIARFSHEIEFAMTWFDRFFARLVRFVDAHPEYAVWVATSMGQAATTAVPMETQLYMTDMSRFMTTIGMKPGQWEQRPAMEPQVGVLVHEGVAERFREIIRTVRIDDAPIHVDEREKGFFCISLGHPDLQGRVESAQVEGREVPLSQLGMENVVIEDLANGSAQHVREGLLLMYEAGGAAKAPGRPMISTVDIAPAILRNFEIPVPDYMSKGELLLRKAG